MQLVLVDFEFDLPKSVANQAKHGVDFSEAQALWQDDGLVILPSRYPDERRYLAIGRIGRKHWTAIFTERKSRIRMISVRRARKEERVLYERNQPG